MEGRCARSSVAGKMDQPDHPASETPANVTLGAGCSSIHLRGFPVPGRSSQHAASSRHAATSRSRLHRILATLRGRPISHLQWLRGHARADARRHTRGDGGEQGGRDDAAARVRGMAPPPRDVGTPSTRLALDGVSAGREPIGRHAMSAPPPCEGVEPTSLCPALATAARRASPRVAPPKCRTRHPARGAESPRRRVAAARYRSR